MYVRMIFFVRMCADFCVRMYADYFWVFFFFFSPIFLSHGATTYSLDNTYFEMSRIDLKRSAVSPQTHTSFLLGGSKPS